MVPPDGFHLRHCFRSRLDLVESQLLEQVAPHAKSGHDVLAMMWMALSCISISSIRSARDIILAIQLERREDLCVGC